MKAIIKTPEQIEAMREGGQILGRVLQTLAGRVQAGMTTDDIDQMASEAVKAAGGEAAFLGHEGFPKSICVSVNDEVVHGIPGKRLIKEGDIVGLDMGVRYKGLITDAAIAVPIGAVDDAASNLLRMTEAALYAGIDQARNGARVGDISAAVEKVLRAGGLGIIKELAGHGVGTDLWEEPQISNIGVAGTGPTLKAGMTIAIEPMATVGSPDIEVLEDKWTIATEDGSLAAQFEHTVLITNGDPEILTRV